MSMLAMCLCIYPVGYIRLYNMYLWLHNHFGSSMLSWFVVYAYRFADNYLLTETFGEYLVGYPDRLNRHHCKYSRRTNWLLHHRPSPVYYHLINWRSFVTIQKDNSKCIAHTLHILSPDILLLVVHSLTIRDTTAPHSKSYLPTTISGFTRITDTGSGASVPILDSESVVDSRQLWVYTTNSSYNDAER